VVRLEIVGIAGSGVYLLEQCLHGAGVLDLLCFEYWSGPAVRSVKFFWYWRGHAMRSICIDRSRTTLNAGQPVASL
jgi:hypothetical protein